MQAAKCVADIMSESAQELSGSPRSRTGLSAQSSKASAGIDSELVVACSVEYDVVSNAAAVVAVVQPTEEGSCTNAIQQQGALLGNLFNSLQPMISGLLVPKPPTADQLPIQSMIVRVIGMLEESSIQHPGTLNTAHSAPPQTCRVFRYLETGRFWQ